MDLQRIRQNLRKKTGRTKLTRKASKSKPSYPDQAKLDTQERPRQTSSDPITALPSLDPPSTTPNQPIQQETGLNNKTQQEDTPNEEVQPEQSKPVEIVPDQGEMAETSSSRPVIGIGRRKSTRYGASGIEIFKDEPPTPPQEEVVEPPAPQGNEVVGAPSSQPEPPTTHGDEIIEAPSPQPDQLAPRKDEAIDAPSPKSEPTALPKDETMEAPFSQPEPLAPQKDDAMEAPSFPPEQSAPRDEAVEAANSRPGTGITRRKSTRYGTSGIEIFKDGPPTPPKEEIVEAASSQPEPPAPKKDEAAEPPSSHPGMGITRRKSTRYGSSGIEIFKDGPPTPPRDENVEAPISQPESPSLPKDEAIEAPSSRPEIGLQRRRSTRYGTSGIEIFKDDPAAPPKDEPVEAQSLQPDLTAPPKDEAIEAPNPRPEIGLQRRRSTRYGTSGIEIFKDDSSAPPRDQVVENSSSQNIPQSPPANEAVQTSVSQPGPPVPPRDQDVDTSNSRPEVGLQRRKSTRYGTSGIEIFRFDPSAPPRQNVVENSIQRRGIGPSRRKSTRYGSSGIEIPMSRLADYPPTTPSRSNQNALRHAESYDELNFDLSPPSQISSKSKPRSIESQYELLFSGDHLRSILHTPQLLSRFTGFLYNYAPAKYELLRRYLETQKVIKAVAYANAVIEGLTPLSGEHNSADKLRVPSTAASLDNSFETFCESAFQDLTDSVLPLYFTYSLVTNISDLSVTTITGKATSATRELVDGLSEVFCLTDPNQEDNPIIYASEEFYRLTRYSQEDVLNYNCRFLQGPRTRATSLQNLRNAIQKGEETSELLLNYRRDGRPFINLLMIAPLHDDMGKVKYFLGAQIDASGMIDGGKGLDSLRRCLEKRESESNSGGQQQGNRDSAVNTPENTHQGRALERLRDLSEMFDLEESAVVQANSRSSSVGQDPNIRSVASADPPKSSRRMLTDPEDSGANDEEGKPKDESAWKFAPAGADQLSGKLPGVYEAFVLIRPAPSLRIVFVSPKLQHLGKMVQDPFMSHVAATSTTLSGLQKSFDDMTPVTAKICFMPERGRERDGTILPSASRNEQSRYGQTCWISCTPLKGADRMVGVWMVVLIEESKQGSPLKQAPPRVKGAERLPANFMGKQNMNDSTTVRGTFNNSDTTQNHDDTISREQGRADTGNGPSIINTTIKSEIPHAQINTATNEQHAAGEDFQHVPSSDNHQPLNPNLGAEASVGASEAEFVQKRAQQVPVDQSERVVIHPESEMEHGGVIAHTADAGIVRDERHEHSKSDVSPLAESPRSVPSDAQFADDSEDVGLQYPGESEREAYPSHTSMASATAPESAYVLRLPSDAGQQDDSENPPSPSPNKQNKQSSNDRPQTPDSFTQQKKSSYGRSRRSTNSTERPISPSSNYKAGGMRLEYVMMPHQNRNATNSYRGGITGGWQVRSRVSSDEDRITDSDECARSPYSVD